MKDVITIEGLVTATFSKGSGLDREHGAAGESACEEGVGAGLGRFVVACARGGGMANDSVEHCRRKARREVGSDDQVWDRLGAVGDNRYG